MTDKAKNEMKRMRWIEKTISWAMQNGCGFAEEAINEYRKEYDLIYKIDPSAGFVTFFEPSKEDSDNAN